MKLTQKEHVQGRCKYLDQDWKCKECGEDLGYECLPILRDLELDHIDGLNALMKDVKEVTDGAKKQHKSAKSAEISNKS